ncbi:MAG TPA: hypothetical protein DCL54_03525 [Alphaproteobacteria bacterium]|nr:hypothetical protein [Alphaproteobacteria bacterium]HAJ45635.1 hypothetical protein [Alphaproteobacteria bacterium]
MAVAASGSASAESDWHYTATLYGWFPGVSTTVETPMGVVESEASFDEILETLDLALFGAFEARNGRFSLIADLQFIDVGAEAEPPSGMFSEAEVDSQLVVFSAYATYALVDTPDLRFDVGAGLRYIDATIDTHLVGVAPTPNASFSRNGGWADALIAARISKQFDERWYGVAYADVGGFGIGDSSDLTWQAFVGAGYRFNETWSAVGGYRHLSVERTFGNFDVTADVSGPFLGFQAAF